MNCGEKMTCIFRLARLGYDAVALRSTELHYAAHKNSIEIARAVSERENN